MTEARRLLVISPLAVDSSALRDEIERRIGDRLADVRLVTPAVPDSKLQQAFGDVDDAMAEARPRLERMLDGLRNERIEVSGAIGDSDPLTATEDALRLFDADEVLIVTHPDREAEWFEEDLFDRAAERFEPPIVHVELVGDGNRLAETGETGQGVNFDESAEDEIEVSPNLPPFSKRDLFGVVVAIVGTIVLALLAADAGDGSSGRSAARILIAIAFALVNLAHVVGLVLFNSQRYRGAGQTLFGTLSLFGTPIAIVVSLLV